MTAGSQTILMIQEYSGDPNGHLTPNFAGALCLDTSGSGNIYKAGSLSNTSWWILSAGAIQTQDGQGVVVVIEAGEIIAEIASILIQTNGAYYATSVFNGSPVGSLTPGGAGVEVIDTSVNPSRKWYSTGNTNADWMLDGGVGQVLSLTYNGQTFDVPVSSLPEGWTGSGTATMQAQLTTGPTLVSGLLDAFGNPVPDGFTFPAVIFVVNTVIYDIVVMNGYIFGNPGTTGWSWYGSNGGQPYANIGPSSLLIVDLPTTDPGSAGSLWSDNGTIVQSGHVAPVEPSPATTVTGPDAFGDSPAVGTAVTFAREDHNHGLPSMPANWAVGILSLILFGSASPSSLEEQRVANLDPTYAPALREVLTSPSFTVAPGGIVMAANSAIHITGADTTLARLSLNLTVEMSNADDSQALAISYNGLLPQVGPGQNGQTVAPGTAVPINGTDLVYHSGSDTVTSTAGGVFQVIGIVTVQWI